MAVEANRDGLRGCDSRKSCNCGCHCSSSAAPKAMQGDFRRTVQAHGNDARSCTHRGVAAHVVMLPGSRPHSSWQRRLQFDRNPPGKTELATVRVATQHQFEIGVGSLTINFRRMRKQNRKLVLRDLHAAFSMLSTLKKCASSIPAK